MKEHPLVDFESLTLPKAPHYCLVYVKEKLGNLKRQRKSPIYSEPLNKVVAAWNNMIRQQPRVTLVKEDKAQYHLQYIQRSKLFRFPDIIDVKFISLNPNQTQLYLYSRSVYGYSDMGVNCQRVDRWLDALKVMLRKSV